MEKETKDVSVSLFNDVSTFVGQVIANLLVTILQSSSLATTSRDPSAQKMRNERERERERDL